MTIFPFTVKAYDNGHYIQQPRCYKSFLRCKPDGVTWYAFDVTLKSKTEAVFTVYGIGDFNCGGIGDKTNEFTGVLDEDDLSLIIDRRVKSIAKSVEQSEYYEVRMNRRKEIEESIMATIS